MTPYIFLIQVGNNYADPRKLCEVLEGAIMDGSVTSIIGIVDDYIKKHTSFVPPKDYMAMPLSEYVTMFNDSDDDVETPLNGDYKMDDTFISYFMLK